MSIKMRLFCLKMVTRHCIRRNITNEMTKYFSRTVTGDKITPPENTLLGRMLAYLNSNGDTNKSINADASTINSVLLGRIDRLRNLNVYELTALFYSLHTNVHSKQNVKKALQVLDVECCLRSSKMNADDLMKIMNAFMGVVPNRILEYRFYRYGTSRMEHLLADLTKRQLMQFVFYIGLERSKRSQALMRKCLRNISKQFLENVTVEDLCIVCNSTYRSGTKIMNTQLLKKIKQTLNDNLHLLNDPALLITLLKSIRHNHYEDEDLLSTISCTIFFNKTVQYYSFTAISHILSLYADYMYYDQDLLNLLAKEGVAQFKSEDKPHGVYLTEKVRAKDIAMFLRALSILGYTEMNRQTLENVVVPKIIEGIKEYDNDELVNCVLALWMLNYRSSSITPLVQNLSERDCKLQCNLNLLLVAMKYEEPDLYQKINLIPNPVLNLNLNVQIKSRPALEKVFFIVQDIASRLNIRQVKLEYQIPHLNVAGISGYTDNSNVAMNIEVLDDLTSVRNQDCYPTGLMQLKLRILDKMEAPLVIICQNDIDSLDDSKLESYIEGEIKLFS